MVNNVNYSPKTADFCEFFGFSKKKFSMYTFAENSIHKLCNMYIYPMCNIPVANERF